MESGGKAGRGVTLCCAFFKSASVIFMRSVRGRVEISASFIHLASTPNSSLTSRACEPVRACVWWCECVRKHLMRGDTLKKLRFCVLLQFRSVLLKPGGKRRVSLSNVPNCLLARTSSTSNLRFQPRHIFFSTPNLIWILFFFPFESKARAWGGLWWRPVAYKSLSLPLLVF